MMVGTIPIIACIPVFILTLFNCKITSLYTITCAHVCASIHFIIHLHIVSSTHDHVDKTNRFLIKRSPWMNIEFSELTYLWTGSNDPVSVRLKNPILAILTQNDLARIWPEYQYLIQGWQFNASCKCYFSMVWWHGRLWSSRPDRMNTALGHWSLIGR